MVLMNNFNKSFYIEQPEVWNVFEKIFMAEIGLLVINIAHTFMVIWLNVTAKQFHTNWTNIFSMLCIQHITASFAWLIQRVILISDIYYSMFIIIKILSYVRNICIFVCLLSLPTLVIERYFATIYVLNYEKKPRVHISYFLICGNICVACCTSIMYHEYDLLLTTITFFLVINGIAVLGNIAILHINYKFYREFHKSKRVCDLTERFQISENIKVCKLVIMIVISMGGFNGLICLTLLIDIFDISDNSKNMWCLAFDVSAFLYSFLFPYICMYYSNRWQIVFFGFLKILFGSLIRKNKIKPIEKTTKACKLHRAVCTIRYCDLAERFQISENIKTCRLVNMIVIIMGGFNLVICFSLLVDIFEITDYNKNILTLLFDLALMFNCYVAFFLWVNITAKQFHQNWTNIVSVINGQHLVATSAWIFHRLVLLSDDYWKNILIVEICSYIRLFCLCYVFLGLPMLIVERYFATLFVKNYEKKTRGYICYLLISGSTVISVVIDIIYHGSQREIVGIIIFTIFMALNAFGIIGNILLFRKNQKFFEEFYSNERSCDLTERFQISENLKSGRLERNLERIKNQKIQPLQNSFGTVMTDASGEAYFDKLNQTWA
ncbi:unnamed protein product [Caenorhabditis angaria]|uniref:Uncharacterized protein n=1 Tax=Caenorhabditis angaria TaxID=860376 RepID=A0A9P1ITC1_9PELO|nr:unnamed protein product [Caenorhabditis angaria]